MPKMVRGEPGHHGRVKRRGPVPCERAAGVGSFGCTGWASGRARAWRVALVALAALLAADAAVWAQAGSGGWNRPEHLDRPYVVLLSLDGMRADYLERVPTPNIDRLIARGVRADWLTPVFPSKTFPNHYSMATGMYVDKHGLIDNSFYDVAWDAWYRLSDRNAVEDGRWYGGEPFWVAAEKAGIVTAAFYWVGTEAAVGGLRPTHFRMFDASVPNEVRIDQVLEWLSLPARLRPHVVAMYLSNPDDVGHRQGPDSPEAEEMIRTVDALIGRLMDGLDALPTADRTYLIVVSDHGMAPVDHGRTRWLDEVIDLTGIRVRFGGPYAVLDFDGDEARLDATYRALRDGLPGVRVYRRHEIPERFRYRSHPRSSDLLVLAEPPEVIGSRARGPGWTRGEHGFDPQDPTMRGVFMAAGPRLRPGSRIPAFDNVHVYALVMELLGLPPNPEADARLDPFAEVLSPARAAVPAGRQ